MKKIKFICTAMLGIASIATAITCPILISHFDSNSSTFYSSWWKLDDNNCIYIKNANFASELNDLMLYDKNNNLIEFNKDLSKIANDGIYLVIDNSLENVNFIKLVNLVTNESISLSNNQIKTFEEYNLLEDQKYFLNFIKDSCSNKIPTIGFIRNASLINQEAFYIALINYFSNYKSDDLSDSTYWFGWDELWSQNKLDFNVLRDANIWDGKFQFSSDIVPNHFNLYKSGNMYNDFNNDTDQIIKYFSIIMQKNNTDKFDFVTDEIQFIDLLKKNDKNFFNFIFKHANRIVILSDGAYHTNDTVPYLVNILNNHNPISRTDTLNMYNEFLKGKRSLTQEDVLDLMLLKNYEQLNSESNFNFIQFVNYDANVFNSIDLNDSLKWNESAFSTNFIDYASILNNANDINDYQNIFINLFLKVDLSLENVFVNGLSQYDPKKKNAIFIGSSLFKPISGEMSSTNFSRLDVMPDVKREVQNTISKFLEKYPMTEYNIIFKLHPVFSNINDPEHLSAINYVKQITNNVITNPIIVNSSIPLETWIAADYYNYVNNSEASSILFKSEKPETWTTFFGLQASSTTIQTTRLFYQSAFGIDKYQVAELIPFSNFPVPKLFPVISRLEDNNSSYDYSIENLNQIENLYKPYCPSTNFGSKNLEKFDSIILNF